MKANFETGLKICSCCKQELPLIQFSKGSRKDGLQTYCKDCKKLVSAKRRKILKATPSFSRNKKYCPVCQKEKEISEFYKCRGKPDGYSDSCKDCKKKENSVYKKTEKGLKVSRQASSKSGRKRFKENSYFRFITEIRSFITASLKRKKKDKFVNYIGCTIEDFRDHIESQFQEGMSWDNHGRYGWHLDHIIPINYFDLRKEDQIYIAWNYRNLQPLWKEDNLSKSDKVPENVEELVEFLKQEIKNDKRL